MPAPVTPSSTVRRDDRPTPLRRKRVQPVPATTPRRRRLLNGLLAFATVVLLVDSLVGDRGLMERMRARELYEQEVAALEAVRYENAVLREKIYRLNNDPAAIESIAREELGLIRPGELLFILRNAPRPASHQP